MAGLNRVNTVQECSSQSRGDVEAGLNALHQADETFHNMMSLEIWAIAQTMDELQPGFWNQYMKNRQTITQQHIQDRQQQQQGFSKQKRSPFAPSKAR